MRILREGDRGEALSPDSGRVAVVYRYRSLTLDSGVEVENVLVGVHEDSGEILVVPAQSASRIGAARRASKEQVLEARIPLELEDVLLVLADRFGVPDRKFTPALIRYYLHRAVDDSTLAERLQDSSRSALATGERPARLRVRCTRELSGGLSQLAAGLKGTSVSDLIRGAIVAAKQDILDGRSTEHEAHLDAIAVAV